MKKHIMRFFKEQLDKWLQMVCFEKGFPHKFLLSFNKIISA